jgi:hypothetical protein
MIASLQNLSFAKYEDNVGVLHRSQTVSNDEHGPTFSGSLKRSLDKLLAFRI